LTLISTHRQMDKKNWREEDVWGFRKAAEFEEEKRKRDEEGDERRLDLFHPLLELSEVCDRR